MKNNCLHYFLVFVLSITLAFLFGHFCEINQCMIIACGHNSPETNQTCNATTEQHDLGENVWGNLALASMLISIFFISFAVFYNFFFDPWLLCCALFAKICKNDDSTSNTEILQNVENDSSTTYVQISQSEEELADINNSSTSNTQDERYIFVDFNAWEYAGSDNLWAAIVINLATAIEKELGVVTSRLFRLIGFEMKQKAGLCRNECCGNENCSRLKPCCNFLNKLCSRLISWILLIFIFGAVIIISITVANTFKSVVKNCSQDTPPIIQGGLWTLSAGGFIYLIVKILLIICQSNTNIINEALKGTKKNMAEQLGFTHKVKKEVQLTTEIVRCAESMYNQKYRIVILIDDLDRVELDKVKSVLDAVNILLSDKNSPFICLIAVDSRIAVKSIEENMRKSLLKKDVTGIEYLKKIINLPFCLPEISEKDKKQFIDGLAWTIKKEKKEDRSDTNPSSYTVPDPSRNSQSNSELQNRNESSRNQTSQEEPVTDVESMNRENFIEECQKFMSNDQTTLSYLDGNPRNIKRIFNILSLTLRVIQIINKQPKSEDFLRKTTSTDESSNENQNNQTQYFEGPGSFQLTKQNSRDLVTWVILTEQWPYSMSYIIHVIEKNDKSYKSEIEEGDHLLDIFVEKVQPKLSALSEEYNKDEALSQDRNQEDFPEYLKELLEEKKTELNKKKDNLLKKIAINLDQSYMQIVQRHSNLVTRKQMKNVATQIPLLSHPQNKQ